MKQVHLVVISGPSGSGKSTALNVLEDMGFYCVDNLPVLLLDQFMGLMGSTEGVTKAAIVVDVREGEFLTEFAAAYKTLKEGGVKGELFFLDASDETLIRRFSETRRRHPLATGESPLEGLASERDLLTEMKALSDMVLDTSGLNVHQLKERLAGEFSWPESADRLSINVVSFGYRFGIPLDADLVLDVRFLPNPFFIDALKDLDGTDPAVKDYVTTNGDTAEFVEMLKVFLDYLVPKYETEGKSYLTIAFGCTGGRHRSVVISELAAAFISDESHRVRVRHRDIGK